MDSTGGLELHHLTVKQPLLLVYYHYRVLVPIVLLLH